MPRFSRAYPRIRPLLLVELRFNAIAIRASGDFFEGSGWFCRRQFGLWFQDIRASSAPNRSHRMMFRSFRVDRPCAAQSFRDAIAHILGSDVLLKLRLMHESRRLFPGSAENEFSSRFVYLVRQGLQCLEAGGIDRGHVTQS